MHEGEVHVSQQHMLECHAATCSLEGELCPALQLLVERGRPAALTDRTAPVSGLMFCAMRSLRRTSCPVCGCATMMGGRPRFFSGRTLCGAGHAAATAWGSPCRSSAAHADSCGGRLVCGWPGAAVGACSEGIGTHGVTKTGAAALAD